MLCLGCLLLLHSVLCHKDPQHVNHAGRCYTAHSACEMWITANSSLPPSLPPSLPSSCTSAGCGLQCHWIWRALLDCEELLGIRLGDERVRWLISGKNICVRLADSGTVSGNFFQKKKKKKEGRKWTLMEQFELSDITKILRTQTRKKHTSFNEWVTPRR